MKIQDILFLIIFIFLLWKRNPRYFVGTGLILFLISIPLFSFWVFFTAERITYYGAGFIFMGVTLMLLKNKF